MNKELSNINKILVCGSRSITNKDFIFFTIRKFVKNLYSNPTNLLKPVIIEGEARGVDSIAKSWAIENGWGIESYPAEWDKYGKSAGYIRNEVMVKKADYVIVIWDGQSKGTKHTMDLCNKYKKPYVTVTYKSGETRKKRYSKRISEYAHPFSCEGLGQWD